MDGVRDVVLGCEPSEAESHRCRCDQRKADEKVMFAELDDSGKVIESSTADARTMTLGKRKTFTHAFGTPNVADRLPKALVEFAASTIAADWPSDALTREGE